MAFVGLKTSEDAQWMLEKWNAVWVDGAKGKGGGQIGVEWAKTVKESQDRPAKRRKVSPNRTEPPAQADARLGEFMSVMKPRAQRSLVQDILDDSGDPQTATAPPPLNPNAVPVNPIRKAALAPGPEGDAKVRDEAIDDDGVDDMEYMRRRMRRTLTEVEAAKDWEQDDEEPVAVAEKEPAIEPEPEPESEPAKEEQDPDEAAVLATGRLFVRNLPYTASSPDIEPLFVAFGPVSQVHLPQDATGRPKGFAYVTFSTPSHALAALKDLDGTEFQGRLMHVMPAVTRGAASNGTAGPSDGEAKGVGRSGVQRDRDLKRKGEASKEWNWASLYMNPDAVASSVAARLNVAKSELFDPHASNPSVRLALAETSVINETKRYLEDQGVDTAAFSSSSRTGRSPTTILVKNIPFGTTEPVVRSMFEGFGPTRRVLVPPAGTMAIVEMEKDEDARAAWKGLAYKRVGNSVVFLEKGPKAMWTGRPPKPAATTTPVEKESVDEEGEEKKEGEDEEEEDEPGSTLFVKNLSFSTTSDSLASAFRHLAGFSFARVQTKADPKRGPEARLSMGFGFVGFKNVKSARAGVKVMEGKVVDGHALRVQFAQRGKEAAEEANGKGKGKGGGEERTSAKLVVKNVPFETSKSELRELFGAYGTLKSLRLPKKLDRSARGFAFVEYGSRKEAERAMETLRHSHLLGRHLVCQYADDEGDGLATTRDLERIRVRSGAHLFDEAARGPSKRKKFQEAVDKGDRHDD